MSRSVRRCLAALLVLTACRAAAPEPAAMSAEATAPEAAAPAPERGARLARVVAVGDLHGDLRASLEVLELAGLVDSEGRWSGGDAVLVQTGDVVDRGPDSRDIIALLARLEGEAEAVGGRVVALLGNHEVMNLMGDWRYVSPGDLQRYGSREARVAAWSEGGEDYARLIGLPMVAVVDRVAYAHGGVTAEYARMGLDGINALVPSVLSGELPPDVLGEDSPIWYRGYVQDAELRACRALEEALLELGAERMVVGHTTRRDGRVQDRCGGRLLVIDTGISAGYGGHRAAVELASGDARALYPTGPEDLPDP
jgi:3',5'-cyclic AMP phosphodiesterase CpdA